MERAPRRRIEKRSLAFSETAQHGDITRLLGPARSPDVHGDCGLDPGGLVKWNMELPVSASVSRSQAFLTRSFRHSSRAPANVMRVWHLELQQRCNVEVFGLSKEPCLSRQRLTPYRYT